jgi:hypothetical protein
MGSILPIQGWDKYQLLNRKKPIQGVSAFSPLNVEGTLIGWWDSSDPLTVTESGGDVSQLDDKSTNDYHLKQLAGTKQPAIQTASQNGLDTILYDGLSHLMATDSFSGGDETQPNTIFMIIKPDTDVSSTHLYYDGIISTKRNSAYQFTGTGNYGLQTSSAVTTSTARSTDFIIHRALFDDTSSSIHVNGSLVQDSMSIGNHALSGLTIASRWDEALWSNIEVGEIIAVGGATATDITNIENRLSTRWGITI